jgi:1-aminocyclopropane-1-carboxylate deaminase/D-cysteine desulfhydrase-like pyridoxal-dependent ACC family enzyme
MAFGGNKLRQLEYYLGEAVAEGSDIVPITGAVQSNFVR